MIMMLMEIMEVIITMKWRMTGGRGSFWEIQNHLANAGHT